MWLAYALIAVLSSTILATIFRVVSVKAKDTRTFSFIFNVSVLMIALALIALTGIGNIDLDPYLLTLLLLSSIGYGIFQRYQFLARKHLESSVTQTIMTPASIIGYILAIVWLNESPTPLKIMGYVLILISTLIVVLKPGKKLGLNKYALLAFLISGALNISIVIDRKVTPHFDQALTYVAIIMLAQVFFTFLPSIPYGAIKREFLLQKKSLLVLAVLNFIALFCTISALQLAPATSVAPIISSNVVFIAIAGIIFLKERDYIGVKLVAAAVACAGLFLVSR
jgi:drug/metabolite transporter (DMT)-like permease